MAREVVSVLWAVKKYRAYLWDQTFTLITSCSALTWIFKSSCRPKSTAGLSD